MTSGEEGKGRGNGVRDRKRQFSGRWSEIDDIWVEGYENMVATCLQINGKRGAIKLRVEGCPGVDQANREINGNKHGGRSLAGEQST